jgi:two-component system, NarL family, response regulator NreC
VDDQEPEPTAARAGQAGTALAVPRSLNGGLPRRAAKPIRVALADDRGLARAGLRLLLQEEPDIEVITGTDDVSSVAHRLQANPPDVLVLDVDAPGANTIAAISSLRRRVPETEIVVLTSEREAAHAADMMAAGALGIVAKEAVGRDLTSAVRAVAHGERHVSACVAGTARPLEHGRRQDQLTTRETEVLRLIALGHTSVEIAKALALSPRTVETHRARIHKKLALGSRAELVGFALRQGLLRT